VDHLARDPDALLGQQERDQLCDVVRRPEPPRRLAPRDPGPDVVVHPAGVDGPRVHRVHADPEVAELAGRGEHDPIQCSLRRAVGHVPGNRVGGQGDDRAPSLAGLTGERLDQLEGGPGIDRDVAVERLRGRVQDPRVA
jgi:hypothetical protein